LTLFILQQPFTSLKQCSPCYSYWRALNDYVTGHPTDDNRGPFLINFFILHVNVMRNLRVEICFYVVTDGHFEFPYKRLTNLIRRTPNSITVTYVIIDGEPVLSIEPRCGNFLSRALVLYIGTITRIKGYLFNYDLILILPCI
ncbi:hypothetical protein L9F63_002330, partial [Diploptera punctata]